MATINGLTAERLLALEADTVIGGHVSGDNLILEQHDGSTIDAGSVRGFPGISDMSLYDPIGVPKVYVLSGAAPAGHGFCDAQTEYDGATYPIFAAEFGLGVACINGVSSAGKFRLPDFRGKTLFGLSGAAPFAALHDVGGTKDAVIVTHGHTASQADHTHNTDLPPHNHPINPGGAHSHSVDGGDFGDRIVVSYGSPISGAYLDSASGYDVAYTHFDPAPDHDHGGATGNTDQGPQTSGGINGGGGAITVNSATGGVSGTNQNLPPYRVVRWIMRLA